MNNYYKPLVAKLSHEEDGQMAVLMIMILPVVFLFFALAMDAGIWFFDHRLVQNQADAAALAAVLLLPAVEGSEGHTLAIDAVENWVTKNGSNLGDAAVPLATLRTIVHHSSDSFRRQTPLEFSQNREHLEEQVPCRAGIVNRITERLEGDVMLPKLAHL